MSRQLTISSLASAFALASMALLARAGELGGGNGEPLFVVLTAFGIAA